MYRSVRYPNTYDVDVLYSRQSPVPSQHMPMANNPYYPGIPIGVSQTSLEPPPTQPEHYVVYTYDSRPGQAQDFTYDLSRVLIPDLGAFGFDGFTVPNGYVFMLRHISIDLNWLWNGAANVITITGNTEIAVPIYLQVTVNGVPVFGYTTIDIRDAILGGDDIDCFIAVNQGDTVNVTTSIGGALFNDMDPQVRFYGNLLFATGRSLAIEYTTPDPVPVEVKQ